MYIDVSFHYAVTVGSCDEFHFFFLPNLNIAVLTVFTITNILRVEKTNLYYI